MNEMTIFVCPRCQQRASREQHSGDFEHTCPPVASEALRNEDILVIGDWVDFTGSDTNVGPNAMVQGQENRLFGTRSWLEGQQDEKRTSRGFPSNRWRTRQHLHFIEDNFFKVREVKRTDEPEEFIQK